MVYIHMDFPCQEQVLRAHDREIGAGTDLTLTLDETQTNLK